MYFNIVFLDVEFKLKLTPSRIFAPLIDFLFDIRHPRPSLSHASLARIRPRKLCDVQMVQICTHYNIGTNTECKLNLDDGE